MSETREQFRERMGFVNYMGALAHVDAEEARADWNDESQFTQDAHKDAAEAVYAQALRDVIAELGDLSPANMVHQLDGYLRIFAIDRGIDLEDDDASQ